MRTKGDLSVDGSLVFKQLRIIRSNIEGSLFNDNTFIQNLSVSNSTINGSASFRESILFQSTQFDDATITRELTVRGSILSYFIAQFSHIGGLLDLSHTAARCAYHINKSEIGFLVAKRTGFGTVAPPPAESNNKLPRYDWRHDFRDFREAVKRIYSSAKVHNLVSEPDSCQNEFKRTYRAEFSIFDSVIKSSLCVSEFDWLAPYPGPYAPKEFFKPNDDTDKFLGTVIAIDENTIGNNFIVDLWSTNDRVQNPIHDKVSKRLHKFEAIGVKAGALVIDFNDSSRNYFTAVDGLQFRRVHNAHATCEYGGSENEVAPILEDRKHTIISDFTDQLELPTVDDVLKWLDLNESGSTQPYAAFATAFETAGLDSTRIKVEQANREVCDRAARWLSPALIARPCPNAARRAETGARSARTVAKEANEPRARSDPASGWSEISGAIDRLTATLSDFSLFMFRAGLWLLADHGYRPAKVLLWITVTVGVYWIVFMLWLRVVAFSSKPKQAESGSGQSRQKLHPISFLFLFDRLLPHYQIISANYEIEKYYKRIPFSEVAAKEAAAEKAKALEPGPKEAAGEGIPAREVAAEKSFLIRFPRLRIFEWKIEPVTNETEISRIENWLLVLRILGVVFAVFLAAAFGALFVR